MRIFKYYILPVIIVILIASFLESLLFAKLLYAATFVYYFNIDNSFEKMRIPVSIAFVVFSMSELLIYYSPFSPIWIKLIISMTAGTTLILYIIRFTAKANSNIREVSKLISFGLYLVIIPTSLIAGTLEPYLIAISTAFPIIIYAYTRVILNDAV